MFDFSNTDLSYLKLKQFDFSSCDLTEANLTEANLKWANLTKSILQHFSCKFDGAYILGDNGKTFISDGDKNAD